MSHSPNTGRLPFAMIVALGAFTMSLRTVTDPDVWWHLRTGQLIWQNHALFRTDPYSFTRFGQSWINHEWLTDALMYLIYRAGSWTALSTVFAVAASTALTVAYRRCDANASISALVTLCGAAAALPSLGVRPQVVSFLLASLFLRILDEAGPSRQLFWLVPLTLLWVNLHAGYAVGIALIVLYLIGVMSDATLGFEPRENATPKLRSLFLVLLPSIAIIAFNPYGMKMYSYPFETLHSQAMQSAIQEWASPNFHEIKHLPTFILLLALLVLFAVQPRKVRPSQMLLLLAGITGALLSVRHIPLFVLIAIPTISRLLQSCADEYGIMAQRRTQHSSSTHTAVIYGLLALVVMAFAIIRVLGITRRQAQDEATMFPQAATSFLSHYEVSGPLLNPYDWGGYLIWQRYPSQLVFIDGRADVYGDTLLNESVSTYYLRGDWYGSLENWGITSALLPAHAPLVQGLKARGWLEMYADSQAVILRQPSSSR